MLSQRYLIYTTAHHIEVYVEQGNKSKYDFVVRYLQPSKRTRTPKHIHIMIDLYLKRLGNEELTNKLLDHVIEGIIKKVQPSRIMPPRLQIFSPDVAKRFEKLNDYGEYSVEFLLVAIELLMLQEKTNYPEGTLNLDGFTKFRNSHDIFSLVSAATFRGNA